VVPSPLADPRQLLGSWRFARVIDDRAAGEVGHVDGRLELTSYDDRIRWEETGRWHRADGTVDVRRGLWLAEEGGSWWVRFEDDRPFHPWAPGERVVHPCDPDTYRGQVQGSLEAWSITWEVSGPRKDYTMVTELVRA
jgi:hypothetical protein